MDNIIALLNENRDEDFAKFHRKLIPTVDPQKVIGVRTPVLRKLAKDIMKQDYCEEFLREEHYYYEEKQLHAFIISGIKDFDKCITELELFLPQIDNWATCDQTSPKIFAKNKENLLPYLYKWIDSPHTYTIRFAIGMFMQHFLKDDFKPEYIHKICELHNNEYYVQMEIAWYLATALAFNWDETIPYIEQKKLDVWVHNKTIQKAIESFRITDEQKAYLRTLRHK